MHSTAISKSNKHQNRKIHTSELGLETTPTRKSNVRDVTRQQMFEAREEQSSCTTTHRVFAENVLPAFDNAECRYCTNIIIYQETTFELCMNVWCKLTFASTSFIFAKQCQIVCLRHEASDLPSFMSSHSKVTSKQASMNLRHLIAIFQSFSNFCYNLHEVNDEF